MVITFVATKTHGELLMESFRMFEAYHLTSYTKCLQSHAIHIHFVLIAAHFTFLYSLGICASAALRTLFVLTFRVERPYENLCDELSVAFLLRETGSVSQSPNPRLGRNFLLLYPALRSRTPRHALCVFVLFVLRLLCF